MTMMNIIMIVKVMVEEKRERKILLATLTSGFDRLLPTEPIVAV